MSKIKLPNGIEFNGKLYNLVELDEIRGKHQNMLIDPEAESPIDYIEPILLDMLIDLTNSDSESILTEMEKKELLLNKLPIQDIQFMLIKIRQKSYGKDFLMSLKCNHCEADNNARLDLGSLEIFPRKDKLKEEECVLPKEGIEFVYKPLTLGSLIKMSVQDGEKSFTKKMMTSLTAFMLGKLGDNDNVQPSDLDELRGSDLEYIRTNVPELSEMDIKVEHTCTSCEKDFEQELPVLAADFLLHTRT